MSWKTQNIAAQKAIAAQSQKAIIPSMAGGMSGINRGYYGGYQQPSKFMAVLASNFMWGEIAPDPMVVRSLYPVILWAIPQLAATLDMHARVIGCPRVESKDTVFQKDFEQFCKEFEFKGEIDFPYDIIKGVDAYAYLLSLQTMTYGQSFVSQMDKAGNLIQRISQPIAFTRLHDSERFTLRQGANIDTLVMDYVHGGITQMEVPETPLSRQALRFRTDPRYPWWGVPLLYGTERAVTAAMMAGEAAKAHNQRVTNPSSILMGSFNPNSSLEGDGIEILMQSKKEWDTKMIGMGKAFAERTRQQNASGSPYSAFEFQAGGEFEIKELVIGKDIKPAATYDDEIKPYLAEAVIGAFGVPDFVGIQTMSGGGIGSDQHTQMTARMEGFGIGCRSAIAPHIQWLFANWALRNSKRVPEYEIVWDGLTISNEKGQAEVQKLYAETEKLHVDAVIALANDIGPQAANEYAIKNALGYAIPKTLPAPPPTPPAR